MRDNEPGVRVDSERIKAEVSTGTGWKLEYYVSTGGDDKNWKLKNGLQELEKPE